MSQAAESGTPAPRVSADLYAEVQSFYAHQMPLLEERRIDEFAATFTEDAVFGYARGFQLTGREALAGGLRANLPHYGDSTIRHWFDSRRIEPVDDGTVRVTANSIVSVTDANGDVTFEPSCTVQDVLVRQDGGWRTASRTISHDLADPGRYFARFADAA